MTVAETDDTSESEIQVVGNETANDAAGFTVNAESSRESKKSRVSTKEDEASNELLHPSVAATFNCGDIQVCDIWYGKSQQVQLHHAGELLHPALAVPHQKGQLC